MKGRGGRGQGFLPGRGGRGRGRQAGPPSPSPVPFVPLPLAPLPVEEPPSLSEALSLSPLFEFSPVWIGLGRAVPPELEAFFASPPGERYLRAMDERFAKLRRAGQQPRRREDTLRFMAATDDLRYHLDNVTTRWRQEFMDSALADESTANTPWVNAVSRAMGTPYDSPAFDLAPLYRVVLTRYARPVVRVDNKRVDPYRVDLQAKPLLGWEPLRTTDAGSVCDLLTRQLLGQNGPKTTYVVDGTNLFYKFDPIDWPARELYRDRNGEYGPVVVFMKSHMFRSKLVEWEEGPTYIYNALQNMHGGVRHGHGVFIVSIEVKSCEHLRAKTSCIEYQKRTAQPLSNGQGHEERGCRIVGENGDVLVPWNHLMCEYDDVAANVFFDHMREALEQRNRVDGRQRDAVIVTDETMQRFIKGVDEIGFLDAAMVAISQNISTRVFRLTPATQRGGRIRP
jgi:hypothetical protein